VDLRVGGDEVGVHLLLFGVFKNLLDEPLEVRGEVFVLLK